MVFKCDVEVNWKKDRQRTGGVAVISVERASHFLSIVSRASVCHGTATDRLIMVVVLLGSSNSW